MNPFTHAPIQSLTQQFYHKYYNDNNTRKIILGINPGRLGAGATGIPFTDTKRLSDVCGIDAGALHTHEPSSVFVYDVIDAFGGAQKFYQRYYINSICPLGFIKQNEKGMVNYNYYDSEELMRAVTPFIIESMCKQLELGIDRSVCFLFGTGKNAKFFSALNSREKFFEKIVPLEHPRFIMQYRLKKKEEYVQKYLEHMSAQQ